MRHIASSTLLSRVGLQVALLAAACSTFTTNGVACVQGRAPSADQKAALARIKGQFERLKTMQKAMQKAAPNAANAEADASAAAPSMVGLWLTTFTSGGEVWDVGFDAWHSDGTQVLNDTPPPATGDVCIGVWVKTGRYTYELNHPTWFFDDTSTILMGVGYIQEKVTIEPSGDSFSGTFSVDGYDLDGNHVAYVDGEISGDRVNTDPPPNAGPIAGMMKSQSVGLGRR